VLLDLAAAAAAVHLLSLIIAHFSPIIAV